jgi:enoyl-CoA hydratase
MGTPVVAAVRGYALGAGAEMAVSADFLVIASDAQMGFPEISIGTFVGGGVTHRLPRLVGLRKAAELRPRELSGMACQDGGDEPAT